MSDVKNSAAPLMLSPSHDVWSTASVQDGGAHHQHISNSRHRWENALCPDVLHRVVHTSVSEIQNTEKIWDKVNFFCTRETAESKAFILKINI